MGGFSFTQIINRRPLRGVQLPEYLRQDNLTYGAHAFQYPQRITTFEVLVQTVERLGILR